MLTASEAGKVFDTVLSSPGMNEMVKIDLKMSRKHVLLLSNVIQRGLTGKGDDEAGGLLANVPKEIFAELSKISEDCLQKAGLSELSEKLKSLNSK